MRRICFTAHITNDTPTAPASFPDFINRSAKAVARRHSATHDWSAIRAHDDAVIWPPRSGKIQRTRADVRLQLSRPTRMRKAERFRVDGPPSNKNGQATSGPAMSVQRGVHVDHQALPQTAYLPCGGCGGRPPPAGCAPPRILESPARFFRVVPLPAQKLTSTRGGGRTPPRTG